MDVSSPLAAQANILITGATGFIGQPLCKALLARGCKLWLLTRRPAVAEALFGSQVGVVSRLGDLPDLKWFAVINLAGKPMVESRWNPRVKQALRDSRIELTYALLSWCRERQQFPQVLVNGSAVGVYGDCGDLLLDESMPPGEDFAARLCADWEEAAQGFAAFGTRVCLLRTGIVLDAGGGALAQMLPAFRMGLGGVMAGGDHFMSWIHRQDLLQIILRLLEDPALSGPVNAVAPGACSNRDFTRLLASRLRRPALLAMPAFLLRLLFGEMASVLLLASQRVQPQRLLQAGFEFAYPQLDDALREILRQ